MIAKNAKIKVIKRGEAAAPPAVKVVPVRDQKRHAAREMVSTVKNWVSDFQARKRDETKAAFEQLLVTKTQPSEL